MAAKMKSEIENVKLLKPDWLLIVNSCVIIFLSIAFVYMSFHVLFSDSDDFMEITSLVFLFIAMPLGILQFLATFKKSVIASRILALYFGIIGLWPSILWTSSIMDLLRDNSENGNIDIPFTFYCFFTVAYIVFCILLNLRWSNMIKKNRTEKNVKSNKKQ